MLTSQEEQKRRKNNQLALKHLELEGMYPSKEMLKDMELFNVGKITKEEFLIRGIERSKKIDNEQRSIRLSKH